MLQCIVISAEQLFQFTEKTSGWRSIKENETQVAE